MLREFKNFILKGNVADLAIAVVIGAAFGTTITALVRDLITPLIAAIGGKPDFGALQFTINNSTFRYGDFLNTVISFVIIAFVIFFLVVKPLEKFTMQMKNSKKTDDPSIKKCPECLSFIPAEAKRCAFCTSKVE